MTFFKVTSPDLQQLTRDLRKHGDGRVMRKELAQKIRKEAKPALNAVKVAYRSAPSKSRGAGSLRRDLAKATTLEVRLSGKRAGVRIHVKGSKMPAGKGGLPRRWEGAPRWRHPVFGDRETWVQQDARPTFYQAVRKYERPVRRAAMEAADDIVKKIANG